MIVKIVTDSTCDLPTDVLAAYPITVIPCYINMDGQSYRDAVDLGRDEFYERLTSSAEPVTTSAPGTGAFLKVYTRLLDGGADAVISIHISAKLSNVANVARLAAEEVGLDRVHVLDGGQLTIGTGLQVREAARASDDGRSVAEILSRIKALGARIHTLAVGDTLTYLKRSGRLTNFQALLGTLLKVKPLLAMHEDVIEMARTRTHQRAWDWLIDKVRELGPLEEAVMVHTHAKDAAETLRAQIQALAPTLPTPTIVSVTPVLGAHLGPGVVGLTCVTSKSS
jgi:DegV family protein with EDD domain